MARLSVNINKVATLRNARGGNIPNLFQLTQDCESFGAEGITVHPRPDERHIRYSDIAPLKELVKTEFNIEGNPIPDFMNLVLKTKPTQATLVPDSPEVLTSSTGYDTLAENGFLTDIVGRLKEKGIRVSIFVDAEEKMVEGAKIVGADRIELYTGKYAQDFKKNPTKAVEAHVRCAKLATEIGLGVNAGHDLDLNNLSFYARNLGDHLAEVSIGHALIADSLYFGLVNTIQMYLNKLKLG